METLELIRLLGIIFFSTMIVLDIIAVIAVVWIIRFVIKKINEEEEE